MSKAKPNQCWLRFSLRTLLGLMIVVCAGIAMFVAYHRNWIRERHLLLEQNKVRYAELSKKNKELWRLDDSWIHDSAKPPGILGAFCEQGVGSVNIFVVVDNPRETPSEVTKARRLFPEAKVSYTPLDKNGQFFPSSLWPENDNG